MGIIGKLVAIVGIILGNHHFKGFDGFIPSRPFIIEPLSLIQPFFETRHRCGENDPPKDQKRE